jgi:hypothetical protein
MAALNSQRYVTGIIFGLAAGLLADSCLVTALYVLIIFIAPVLLVAPIVGIICGIRLAKAGIFPRLCWLTLVILGAASLVLAVLAPFYLSVFELRWHGLGVPIPPGATITETLTRPFGSSMAGPSVAHLLATEATDVEILRSYQEQLAGDGWKEVRASEEGAWFTKAGKHIFLEFMAEPDRSQIKVKYHIDGVIAPWIILLLLFVTALYFAGPRFFNYVFRR